ncbi:cell division control protein 48 homolog C-like [Silene latifolia]|uniref:cell division control protein 48 homolog C-like n=1 Tax=Silene latifolia TaxID=37657 RepID=UPI003D78452C
MGRRGSGGGPRPRKQSTLTLSIIRRRIDSCKINHLSTDDIADHLYSSYPDYKHFKLLPFRRKIKQLLDQYDAVKPQTDSPGPTRKKRRQSPHDDVDDVSSGAEHTSDEDGVYGEDVEPEFDVMKSLLRERYNNLTPKKAATGKSIGGGGGGVERNVEVEDVRREKNITGGVAAGAVEKSGSELVEEGEVKGKGKEGGIRFKDFGGIKKVIDELLMEVIVPLYHPQLPEWIGVKPMSGILLHGPPGCGKTRLAQAIANETGVPFYQISATEVVSGVSGASEENIRELFSKAYQNAPSIVFIDEIDAIASKRENLQREMERRIVTQLLTCMDESHRIVKNTDKNSDIERADKKSGYVLVIGATNRPDAVDAALRRPGRFDREIALGVPDENARADILSVLTQNLRLAGDFDLMKIAKATPGFVGADLAALANKAGNLAMQRIIDLRRSELSKVEETPAEEWWKEPWSPEEMAKLNITMTDFEEAAKSVQPSSRREGFSTIPDVKWEDVGGLNELRKQFELYIVNRIKYPTQYEESGVDLETGFLLYGPPGCGKTLIAKAVANEAGANFIHIKGPELLNKYVGESESHVRRIFSRARTCAPCIIFFDEVDALTTERGKEGGWVVERLLNQLLIELNGGDHRRGVYVIGATNRPEVMDHALLRPGRFGKLLYVPLPSSSERGLILKALARKKPIDESVNLLDIGERCENMSGADLAALVNEAAMAALEEKLTSNTTISTKINSLHFEQALSKVKPSVSDKIKQSYHKLSQTFRAA